MIRRNYSNVENLLNDRLKNQIKIGKLEGEQWFRNSVNWLLLCFNNPFNFKYSNNELAILQYHQKQIKKYIKGFNQIHYGVGVGETEMELVRLELENSGNINLDAVDVNKTFLKLFCNNLKYKKIEFSKNIINANLIQNLFQNYKTKFINKTLHICLGSTLGNFDNSSKELWDIFVRNSKKGDMLLLGVKLNTHIELDFIKYRENVYYPEFVLSYLKRIRPELITWKKKMNT